jgi:hypothetical protein
MVALHKSSKGKTKNSHNKKGRIHKKHRKSKPINAAGLNIPVANTDKTGLTQLWAVLRLKIEPICQNRRLMFPLVLVTSPSQERNFTRKLIS